MSAIQKIFRTYGNEYLGLYGDRMPGIHKRVIRDMCECRRGHFGAMLYECDDCNTMQPVPCCCGNRHCPSCHQYKAEEWLHKQMENLLPTHYILLTATLPEEFRDLAGSNQRVVYKAMFSCAHGALRKLAKDKKYVGSDRIGYLAVLHTWAGFSFTPISTLLFRAGLLIKMENNGFHRDRTCLSIQILLP
ncbi:MAG: transposase zinc-binding domain-containing protein [Thermodesulfobacteriota bacterium]|nr:transposase zinc-binding domain-containing protein [Thermodesulfobacteriota bacterium]